MSTIKANDIQNASGGIPTVKSQQLIPTAWVNFNGTGTVAIRDSENVSSITDNGTGDYILNFATAMANSNYSVAGSASINANNHVYLAVISTTTLSTLSARMRTAYIPQTAGSSYDSYWSTVIILGGQA